MKKRDKNKIARSCSYWQERAESFDAQYEGSIFGLKWITRSFLNKRTKVTNDLVHFSRLDRLLDVGCGSGIHMAIYADKVAEIVGLDCSKDMLRLCKKRLTSIGVSNFKLVHGNVNSLPFSQDSFDCIISLGLLDYVEDPRTAIAEFHRVLRNSGWLIFTIPKRPSIFSFFRSNLGLIFRDKLFNLPPIVSAVSRLELESLLNSPAFQIQYLGSLWTTMWIVKATKQ